MVELAHFAGGCGDGVSVFVVDGGLMFCECDSVVVVTKSANADEGVGDVWKDVGGAGFRG